MNWSTWLRGDAREGLGAFREGVGMFGWVYGVGTLREGVGSVREGVGMDVELWVRGGLGSYDWMR